MRLETEINRLLRDIEKKAGTLLTVGTAESASGGRIADKLTNVPGSSAYFKGGIVSYANEVKMGLLTVEKATLDTHGAVSRETALQMAEGGRRLLKVDICLSDTGIAGPGGATRGKPLGLFYIALAAADTRRVERHVFKGTREQNKREAVNAVLAMLRDYLENCSKKSRPSGLRETHVVTSFLEHGGKVLILRRSRKVGSYQGHWSGISGYLEQEPEAQARTEIEEEVGLGVEQLTLLRSGEPVPIVDAVLGHKWVVHPFLFHALSAESVRLDWENTEARWIDPAHLHRYRTVPGLKEVLERVIPARSHDMM